MPLIETQPDAVSKVYAQSLFDSVFAKGGQQAVEHTLAELEGLMELARTDKRFNEFLASRIIGVEKRSDSLGRMLAGKISEPTVRFLQVLNDKGRLHAFPAMVSAFDSIAQEGFGRVEVDVYTAAPLSESDKAALAAQLQAKLGKPPVLHAYTDPSMLGGIRIQIGDRLIDASLGTRLAQLREQIAAHGLPTLRAAADRIIKSDAGPALNGH
ncbi:MAG TPA: ATP synthase F1 subunit delta [Phycisphaerales bacterium]|nr:ATP synthase F1 subunit delta [Phycisphaerales bacterium]